MKPIIAACCLAAFCALNLSAQTRETETKSKTTVKDGKEVTVTGCVARAEDARSQYMLTNVADKVGALGRYLLISDDADLAKHVGHLVQVRGKATDRGDAKIEVETKTKVKVENGPDNTTRSKVEIKGNDVADVPLLGVTSVKMLAAACQS